MKQFLLLLLCCTLNCFGATFYVATNGNDAAAGTIGAPWLTIRHGVITMSGGDLLNIRQGIYGSDGFELDEIKSGTGTPTIIQSYTNESVVFYPSNFAHGILIAGKSNIVLNGFTVNGTNCSSDGIKLTGGTLNVTITNMTVRGVGIGMGILATGNNEGDLMNSIITHCNLITNGWGGPFDYVTNHPDLHQIYIQTSGMIVDNCYVEGGTNTHNWTPGIHYFGTGCTNGVFRNNFFTNCGTGIIAAATQGSNCWIYNNVFIGGHSHSVDIFQMSFVYLLNNTSWSNVAGLNIRTSTNIWAENNITANNLLRGIYLLDNANGVTVLNNLSYTNTFLVPGFTGDFQVDTAFNVTTNNNLFRVQRIAGTETTNSTAYDAKFVSPAGGNFQVLAGSDAIGRGKPQTVFNTDAAGNIRINWTIGAYEFLMPTTFINNALIYNVHGL